MPSCQHFMWPNNIKKQILLPSITISSQMTKHFNTRKEHNLSREKSDFQGDYISFNRENIHYILYHSHFSLDW